MAQNIFARKRKAHPAAAQPFVYIGTDTINSPAKGVYLARFNPATGQLSTPQLAAETVRPSFMAAATVGRHDVLYTANEGQDEHSSGISSFLIDSATGALQPLNKVSAGGPGPCYVSVDATSTTAFCANYMGSSVASFRVNPDGTLSEPVDRLNFKLPAFGHHGPNTARQDASHPHSAQISPDNRFLVVNDLGNDNIVTFFIHPDTAQLGPPQLNACRVPGSGPRHVVFHPNHRWVYGINELSSTLQQYLWTATHGVAPVALLTEAGPAVSTLDPNFHGPNTAAEVALTPEGDFLLCSNRGENSLAVFHVDGASGALTLVQRVSCGGKTPRQFTLDPTGKWLLCGNQDSSTITVFALNPSTGQLIGPVQTLPVPMPQMILFA
jgi:6-phosphogluconolactonase